MTETVKPTRHLNYPGRLTKRANQTQIVGPDMFGGFWRPVTWRYNPKKDVTRVGFLPHYIAAN